MCTVLFIANVTVYFTFKLFSSRSWESPKVPPPLLPTSVYKRGGKVGRPPTEESRRSLSDMQSTTVSFSLDYLRQKVCVCVCLCVSVRACALQWWSFRGRVCIGNKMNVYLLVCRGCRIKPVIETVQLNAEYTVKLACRCSNKNQTVNDTCKRQQQQQKKTPT